MLINEIKVDFKYLINFARSSFSNSNKQRKYYQNTGLTHTITDLSDFEDRLTNK